MPKILTDTDIAEFKQDLAYSVKTLEFKERVTSLDYIKIDNLENSLEDLRQILKEKE